MCRDASPSRTGHRSPRKQANCLATKIRTGLPIAFSARACTERLSSCDFAGLKGVDRLGELPGEPGAATELPQDASGLELGIGAFTGGAKPDVRVVGVFLGGGLVAARYRVRIWSSPR